MSADATVLTIIVFGAFAAAFVAGVAGFGDTVVASAIWLQFISPIETVTLAVGCFFVMHVVMLALMWRKLDFSKLLPFVIAGAIGVPIGAYLLTLVPPHAFKLGAGVFLIAYALVMLRLTKLPPVRGGGAALDAAVGGIGGVLGGFAGLSGFIPGLWCGQRGWAKAVARGVTQPFIMIMHGIALGSFAYADRLTAETGFRFLIALPAIALGAWLGLRLYHMFDEHKFRQTVLIVLAGAGAILLLNPGGQ